jgi:hypothetical protein
MDDITATFTLRLTPEDLYTLLSRTLGRGEPVPPAIVAAIVEATPPPTPNVTFNSPEPEVIPVEPPPLPPKPTRSRAKTNGAEAPINSTPLAPPPPPPPEALDEPAMRSLLSKVGAVHPLKVKAITDLLEAHGGKRRLSECDPSTWPAIAEAAKATLAEHGA